MMNTNIKVIKLRKSLDNVSQTWRSLKKFMKWKCKGTPDQILKGNILFSKAIDIANIMNKYFIEKVQML